MGKESTVVIAPTLTATSALNTTELGKSGLSVPVRSGSSVPVNTKTGMFFLTKTISLSCILQMPGFEHRCVNLAQFTRCVCPAGAKLKPKSQVKKQNKKLGAPVVH